MLTLVKNIRGRLEAKDAARKPAHEVDVETGSLDSLETESVVDAASVAESELQAPAFNNDGSFSRRNRGHKLKRPKSIANGGGPSLDWIFISIFFILAFTVLTANDLPQFESYSQAQERYSSENGGEFRDPSVVPSAPPPMPVRSVPLLERAADKDYHYPGLGKVLSEENGADKPIVLSYDPSQDTNAVHEPTETQHKRFGTDDNESSPQSADSSSSASSLSSSARKIETSKSASEQSRVDENAVVEEKKGESEEGVALKNQVVRAEVEVSREEKKVELGESVSGEKKKGGKGKKKKESVKVAEESASEGGEMKLNAVDEKPKKKSPRKAVGTETEAVENGSVESTLVVEESEKKEAVVEEVGVSAREKKMEALGEVKKPNGKGKGKGKGKKPTMSEEVQGKPPALDSPPAADAPAIVEAAPAAPAQAAPVAPAAPAEAATSQNENAAKVDASEKVSVAEGNKAEATKTTKERNVDEKKPDMKPDMKPEMNPAVPDLDAVPVVVDPFQVTGTVATSPKIVLEPFEENMMQYVKQIVRKHKVRVITDLACVQNAPWLAKLLRVKKLKKLVCVDYHQENLNAIKEAYPEFQGENVQFLRGEPAKVWVPKSDLVIVSDALQLKSKGDDAVAFMEKTKEKERASLAIVFSSPSVLSNRFVPGGAPGDLNIFKPPFNIKRSAALTVGADVAPNSEPKKIAFLYRVDDLVPKTK